MLVSSAAFGQSPSSKAVKQLDSLATVARSTRVENAACVAGSAASIDSLTPASYVTADSNAVYTYGALYCPAGTPFVHTHLHLARASALDSLTKRRSGAPYALIVALTPASWLLVRY